jgi:hypothetical protein
MLTDTMLTDTMLTDTMPTPSGPCRVSKCAKLATFGEYSRRRSAEMLLRAAVLSYRRAILGERGRDAVTTTTF